MFWTWPENSREIVGWVTPSSRAMADREMPSSARRVSSIWMNSKRRRFVAMRAACSGLRRLRRAGRTGPLMVVVSVARASGRTAFVGGRRMGLSSMRHDASFVSFRFVVVSSIRVGRRFSFWSFSVLDSFVAQCSLGILLQLSHSCHGACRDSTTLLDVPIEHDDPMSRCVDKEKPNSRCQSTGLKESVAQGSRERPPKLVAMFLQHLYQRLGFIRCIVVCQSIQKLLQYRRSPRALERANRPGHSCKYTFQGMVLVQPLRGRRRQAAPPRDRGAARSDRQLPAGCEVRVRGDPSARAGE